MAGEGVTEAICAREDGEKYVLDGVRLREAGLKSARKDWVELTTIMRERSTIVTACQ
jgi:hypothetical protein